LQGNITPLVRAAILGDKDALGDLCILCKPIFAKHIHEYVTRRGFSPSMAEDLLQDTYLEVVKSFPYYDPAMGSGNVFGLMKTIVTRVCAVHSKLAEYRRKEIPMSDLDDSEDSEDSGWTVTDGMVAAAWMAENSPGYTEAPIPSEKATTPKRPRLCKTPPKPKKARARRLSEDELQRREKSRQAWAAELQTAG